MAQALTVPLSTPTKIYRHGSAQLKTIASNRLTRSTQSWGSLQKSLKCNGRVSCLFSGNRKQDEARKALESALGGKKTEFEKWDKEIKRREESGGGGNSGKGGWFGSGGWFGWFNDENFWPEAQQASLTLLAILALYLIVTKGDVMIAVIFNPLLFALRGTRTTLTYLMSKITNKVYPSGANFATPNEEMIASVSAKQQVVGKWGNA